jgi:hypothetical protein
MAAKEADDDSEQKRVYQRYFKGAHASGGHQPPQTPTCASP